MVREGDSINRVQAILGSPNGAISVKEIQTYFFDRGEVIFIDGVVTEIKLVSTKARRQRNMPERKNGANSQSYSPKSVINSESSGGSN